MWGVGSLRPGEYFRVHLAEPADLLRADEARHQPARVAAVRGAGRTVVAGGDDELHHRYTRFSTVRLKL